jgi:hypothetical protein
MARRAGFYRETRHSELERAGLGRPVEVERPRLPDVEAARPGTFDPAGLVLMQRSAGNAAVGFMIQRAATASPGRRPVPRPLAQLVQRAPLRTPTRRIRSTDEIEREARPLADKMGEALDHWKGQAFWGIQNFVNEELEKRIDKLRSAGLSTKSFLQSLAGNVIWAAACFIPGSQLAQFVVSMAGIAVAAGASPPSTSDPADKGAVSGMAEAVQGYLDRIEDELRGPKDSRLLEEAKRLVLFNDGLTQAELLERFLTQSFDKSLLRPGIGGNLTGFNDAAIKKTQKAALVARLEHFMKVVPMVGQKTEPETVVGRKIGGEYTLRLIVVSGVGGEGPEHVRSGIGYVLKPRVEDLHGRVKSLGRVVIAEWIEPDVVNDVLRRQEELKIYPLIVNAFATEVAMGPDEFRADQARQREQNRLGGLRPG